MEKNSIQNVESLKQIIKEWLINKNIQSNQITDNLLSKCLMQMWDLCGNQLRIFGGDILNEQQKKAQRTFKILMEDHLEAIVVELVCDRIKKSEEYDLF